MTDSPYTRRTALKIAGAGLVGGAVAPEVVSAEKKTTYDGTFHLFEAIFDVLPGTPHFKNEVMDPGTGNVLEIRGSGIFDQDGTEVSGGGSYTLRDSGGDILMDGTWMAEEVLAWDPYKASKVFPKNWYGGYLELATSFDPDPPGAFDPLIIECHEGSTPDERRLDEQGVNLGDYTDVVTPATIFHLNKKKEK